MEQVEFELLPNGECVVKQRGIILFQIEAGTMYLLAASVIGLHANHYAQALANAAPKEIREPLTFATR
jgi:hypothetical protein